MGERLQRLKKGFIYGAAALGIMSSSGFLVRDNNFSLEKAVQEQYERQDIDGAYDYDTECIENLEDILKEVRASTYRINVYITYITEGGNNAGINGAIASGSAVLLENGYFLTAAHVISEMLEEFMDEDSGNVISFYAADYTVFANGKSYKLEPVWTDDVWTDDVWAKNEDFALLKFAEEPGVFLPSFNYELGDSGKLRNGSVTFTFSAVNIPDIKQGNVLNSEKGAIWGENTDYNYFLENTKVISGDSGGPVIAFLDGKPQLIGITCYITPYFTPYNTIEPAGGILKINVILQEAGQFFEINF